MTLTDLFNPTFFMFLGILLLVAALIVIYFENKMRDQNHKIASMLSLVSTLAEDTNRVKLMCNRLSTPPTHTPSYLQPSLEHKERITVSDDEEASEFNDSDESDVVSTFDDDDDKSCDNSIIEDDDDTDVSQNEDIKVLKLNIDEEERNNDDTLELEITDDLDEFDDEIHSENSDIHSDDDDDDVSEGEEEKETTTIEDNTFTKLSISDLKTININLEEPQSEMVDFKKMPLNKLRSIVAEKGLSADAPKLKKNELLKLLEID